MVTLLFSCSKLLTSYSADRLRAT